MKKEDYEKEISFFESEIHSHLMTIESLQIQSIEIINKALEHLEEIKYWQREIKAIKKEYKINKQMKTTDLEVSRNLVTVLRDNNYIINTFFVFNRTDKLTLFIPGEYFQVSAFTMCELWDMLPKFIKNIGRLVIRGGEHFTQCGYGYGDDNYIDGLTGQECNTLANLVIWCIENNHELNLEKTK